MILMLAKTIDLGRYLEVLNIVNRFHHRLETIGHIDWPSTDLSTLGAFETLYISAHGTNDDVEGRTPEELADELIAKGLKENVKLKKIKLMSCGSGITSSGNVPFNQRLAQALADRGGPKDVLVVAFDGATTVCDPSGKVYAKNIKQSQYDNWSEFVAKHQDNFSHWNQVAKNLPCKNTLDFVKNALMLQSVSEVKEAFEWLYAENPKYVIQDSRVGKTYATAGKSWKKA